MNTTQDPWGAQPGKDTKLLRDLRILPRGGKDWRAVYSRYRRTDHWKRRSASKLETHPFCQMCTLMGVHQVPASEVHHAQYNFFHEAVIGELVSICRHCHRLWSNRYGRK